MTIEKTHPHKGAAAHQVDAHIRRALDDISDGFFIVDNYWRFLYINKTAFARMAGSFNTPDVLGKVLWDVAPQLVGSDFESAYRRAMAEHETVHLEANVDGDGGWYEVHAYPSDGTLAVAFHDITELKKAELKSAERQKFMSDASQLLTGTLDFRETLRHLVHLAVPRIADWCAVYLEGDDGNLHVVEVAHADPAKISVALEMNRRFPPDPERSGAARVHHTGETAWTREITDEMFEAAVRNPDHRDMIQSLGLRSFVIVPLAARDSKLGVMAFIYAESGRLYDEDDVAFAEDLARRAAIAADNARLFEEAERRAREESALRKATEAVAATFSVEDVIRQIAESALIATGADGSFVERIQPDQQDVIVVATAGSMAPQHGDATAFEGSLAQLVLERKQPQVIKVLGQTSHPLPGTLAKTYASSSAVGVPLIDAGEAIGALILLRSEARGPFTQDEAQRAHTFGNLASLAFRKVHLLEAAEQRSRELEQVMESRTRLIRGFSHDLKNPLGAADGHAALLEDGVLGELSAQQQASVTRIRAAIKSAVSLISDLVELARAESGQIVLKQQPVDVREIAREMVEQYRPAAEQAGLSIQGVLNSVAIITSDADRLRQVLGNLLSNAVKYTRSGGSIEVRTDMRASAEGAECAVIDVVDTGLGIPEDKLGVLFTEFERIDPMVKPGAGLGLAISRRIARLLGGDITVATERGSGSTFTLWIPRAEKN